MRTISRSRRRASRAARSSAPAPDSSAETRRVAPSWASATRASSSGASVKTPTVAPVRDERLQSRARRRIAAEIGRRVILGEALEEHSPVSGACTIERLCCLDRGPRAATRDRSRGPRARTRARPPTAAACLRLRRGRRRAPSRPSCEPARSYRLPEQDARRDARGVDRDVERRAEAARDEALMHLVGDRVQHSDRERRSGATRRANEAALRAPRTRRHGRSCAARDPSRRGPCRGPERTRTRR